MPVWLRSFVLLGWIGCTATPPSDAHAGTQLAPDVEADMATAVFAGGCFWCMEKPFDSIAGVMSTTSGYTGGTTEGPTYKQVSSAQTTHAEAIRIVYDPTQVSYSQLLQVYWRNIDPTQANGQFCDHGPQYRTAIFTSDPKELVLAQATAKQAAELLGAQVVTQIAPASPFWVAEQYHQDFYQKEPAHYLRYRTGCGRDARLAELWGEEATHAAAESPEPAP